MDTTARYELLMSEYNKCVKQCSNLQNHSTMYLVRKIAQINKIIERIKAEPDDDYNSGAAALVRWKEFRQKLLNTATVRLNK